LIDKAGTDCGFAQYRIRTSVDWNRLSIDDRTIAILPCIECVDRSAKLDWESSNTCHVDKLRRSRPQVEGGANDYQRTNHNYHHTNEHRLQPHTMASKWVLFLVIGCN